MTTSPFLVGCDFSSSPTKRKPVVVAVGHAKAGRVQLQSLLRFDTLASFSDWLKLQLAPKGGFLTSWSNGVGDKFATAQAIVPLLGKSYLDLLP